MNNKLFEFLQMTCNPFDELKNNKLSYFNGIEIKVVYFLVENEFILIK